MVRHEVLDTDDTESSAKRSYSVPAAEKALDIIEFMAGQPDGMTVTELAGALGRSVHEFYRRDTRARGAGLPLPSRQF